MTFTLCLFEDAAVDGLRPLTAARPVYALRLGLRTVLQSTHDAFGAPHLVLHTRPSVAGTLPHDVPVNTLPDAAHVLFVNGRYRAEDGPVLDRLRQAPTPGETARVFVQDDALIAAWVPNATSRFLSGDVITLATFADLPSEPVEGARLIGTFGDLLDGLPARLTGDVAAHMRGRPAGEAGARVHPTALLIEPDRIYLASGAEVYPGAILNAQHGPIYLDAGAAVMEGAVLRGPVTLGAKTQVHARAVVDSSATGARCTVGGVLSHSILLDETTTGPHSVVQQSYLGQGVTIGAGAYVAGDAPFGLVAADGASCPPLTVFEAGSVLERESRGVGESESRGN